MAAPGSLQGPARPPAGLSPPDSAATAATRSEKSQFPHCTVRFTQGKSHFPGRAAGCASPPAWPAATGQGGGGAASPPPPSGTPLPKPQGPASSQPGLSLGCYSRGGKGLSRGKAALKGGETCSAASWPLPGGPAALRSWGGQRDAGGRAKLMRYVCLCACARPEPWRQGPAFQKVLTPKGQRKRQEAKEREKGEESFLPFPHFQALPKQFVSLPGIRRPGVIKFCRTGGNNCFQLGRRGNRN